MFHELVALVHVMVAVDVPFRLSSVVVMVMVVLSLMVVSSHRSDCCRWFGRSTKPEMVVLFPMFPTWSLILQLMVNAVVWPAVPLGVMSVMLL